MRCLTLVLLVVIWKGAEALFSVSLTPGEVYKLKSPSYPREAGSLTPTSWIIRAPAGYKIQVNCPDIRLGYSTDKTCRNRLIFREERQICSTQAKGAHFIIQKGSILVDLIQSVGVLGNAAVWCDIRAIPMDSNPNPAPMAPKYFSKESWEDDSSELGGPPGRRSTSCPCGWANKGAKRIVLGKETKRNEYPFMVALLEKKDMRRFCGGAIITTRHVITAAHCTERPVKEKKQLTVVIGAHNIEQLTDPGIQIIDVKHVYEHSEWNSARIVHDIALLVLQKDIVFSDIVGPACVSPVRLNIEKKYVRTIGWGRTSHVGPSSNVLLKVDTRVMPLSTCQKRWSAINVTAKTQICNYGNDKDSCMGDSGGPVIWADPDTNRYNLVGLVSYGRICGDYEPSINTDVSAYYSWIQQRIAESSSNGEKTCHKV